jgi:replicative DNA helicase
MIYRHVSYAATEALSYMEGRAKGLIKSVEVGSSKVNDALLGGIEWNRILTLGGLSGSGKSLICEQWKREMIDLNQDQKFYILSFEFEMLARDQIIRNLSGKMQVSTNELLSGKKKLSAAKLNKARGIVGQITDYPIYYVDNTGTVQEIVQTILDFTQQFELKKTKAGLIVTIDHVLLTKGRESDAEKKIIDHLYKEIIRLKKDYDHNGMKIIFILLSQLNREIEQNERMLNPTIHYPTKNDLFGASSVYYSSDYVIISHKPANLTGITKGYGPPIGNDYPNGLPIYNPEDQDQAMVYWHLIKNRTGELGIFMMLDDFKNSRILDYTSPSNN